MTLANGFSRVIFDKKKHSRLFKYITYNIMPKKMSKKRANWKIFEAMFHGKKIILARTVFRNLKKN